VLFSHAKGRQNLKSKGGAMRRLYFLGLNSNGFNSAILIIKIVFLKARRWRAFKKTIWMFPAPKALETSKSVS
jgi:hypothetical protein